LRFAELDGSTPPPYPAPQSVAAPFDCSRTDIQRLANRLIRPLTLSGVDVSFQYASMIDFVNWGFPWKLAAPKFVFGGEVNNVLLAGIGHLL